MPPEIYHDWRDSLNYLPGSSTPTSCSLRTNVKALTVPLLCFSSRHLGPSHLLRHHPTTSAGSLSSLLSLALLSWTIRECLTLLSILMRISAVPRKAIFYTCKTRLPEKPLLTPVHHWLWLPHRWPYFPSRPCHCSHAVAPGGTWGSVLMNSQTLLTSSTFTTSVKNFLATQLCYVPLGYFPSTHWTQWLPLRLLCHIHCFALFFL